VHFLWRNKEKQDATIAMLNKTAADLKLKLETTENKLKDNMLQNQELA